MKRIELGRLAVKLRGMYLASLLLLLGCDAFETIRGRVYGTDNPALSGFRIVPPGEIKQMDRQEMWPLEGATFNHELLKNSVFEKGIICEHFTRVVWLEFSKEGYRSEVLEIRLPEGKELHVILLRVSTDKSTINDPRVQ